MAGSPVTLTFPATPEFLRLARLATADAASRAGLDYEEIDDARIAVSESCSVLAASSAGAVTLTFHESPGRLSVEGEAPTDELTPVAGELTATIIAAVSDEHAFSTAEGITRFVVTKRSRRHPD
jgi:serine/threonine-protein kinase RsbW